MNSDIAIKVENLTKIYKLYNSPQDRLKEALHPLRKKYHHDFHALNDVSFEVKKGETVGIIGKNGSGKSTLLKTITGVLTPSSGLVTVNGRISAILELGSGFNPELTGIENIYFNGTIQRFTKDEMDAKLEDILSFADIGEYINQPVKTYSSGMFVRLAFAVAVIVKPNILIVDEALSVGDVFFQQKCFAKMREILSDGTTCLFVSHDTQAITNICDRAILLTHGAISFQGAPEIAVSKYFAAMGKRAPSQPYAKSQTGILDLLDTTSDYVAEIHEHSILDAGVKRHGAGGLVISAARVTDCDGIDTLNVNMMGTLHIHLILHANDEIYDPSAGIHIYDRLGNLVFGAGTRQLGKRMPSIKQGQDIVVQFVISLDVQPGEYTFSLGCSEPSDQGPNFGHAHDRCEQLGPIKVIGDPHAISPFYGIAKLPMEISFSDTF